MLWWGALLTCLLVQVPGVGNIDTARRLQVTRSLWTDAPPVRLGEYPGFGIRNRDGVIHAWYGVGQSLVMLPADIVSSLAERFAANPDDKRRFQSGIVATLTFAPINATSVVLAFILLGLCGYGLREQVIGALSLLLGTTFLHYCQIHMENSLQDFLLLADAVLLMAWSRNGHVSALLGAALVLGFSMQVRLPSVIEHGTVWMAVVWLKCSYTKINAPLWRERNVMLPAVLASVCMTLSMVVDRIYHFHRFGTWVGTYIHEYGREARAADPNLPPEFPFSGDFVEGFWGPLLSSHRSVFIYDPLLVLLLVSCVIGWRVLPRPTRAFVIAGAVAMLGLVTFYSLYVHWDGAVSWGNRFTLPPVHLILVFALPASLKTFGASPFRLKALKVLVAYAVAVQSLSVLLPPNAERVQKLHGEGNCTLILRLKNVAALLVGDESLRKRGDEFRLNLTPANLGKFRPGLTMAAWVAWSMGLLASIHVFRRILRDVRTVESMRPGDPRLDGVKRCPPPA